MVTHFRSLSSDPFLRGQELGARHGKSIIQNVKSYHSLFCALADQSFDLLGPGDTALLAIKNYAPELHAEIRGIAAGAGLDARVVAALNARTEIMALLHSRLKGECSVAIFAPDDGVPLAVQTWDWYCSFADGWLVWEIPQADGSCTKTVTEYGIVGKAGLNTRGLGLLFTILRHENDGNGIGVPVHVIARTVLDQASDLDTATGCISSAKISASSSLNLVAYKNGAGSAATMELSPAGSERIKPSADKLLLHTNHFLADSLKGGDVGPQHAPDTYSRLGLMRDRLNLQPPRGNGDLIAMMSDHAGGASGLCCHADKSLEPKDWQATLATIALDVAAGVLDAYKGGPCGVTPSYRASSST